jgi:hypothetical protein
MELVYECAIQSMHYFHEVYQQGMVALDFEES